MTYIRKTTPHGNRKYSVQHVRQWREMMRAEKLTLLQLSSRVDVPMGTLHRLLSEDARGEL